MNWIAIALAIMVFVLVYILYQMYTDTTPLTEKVDLKETVSAIPIGKIENNGATRYSYGVWIFVNSWSNLREKDIFSRKMNSVDDFRLYLDKDAPKLKCAIRTGDTETETITLTDNFPVQKWVFVIVSMDGQIADFYLDGKLVVSKKLKSLPVISKSDIQLGQPGQPADILLTRFYRWPSPVTPQDAWKKYMDGNGISKATLPDYGMKLVVLKDGVDQKQLNVF